MFRFNSSGVVKIFLPIAFLVLLIIGFYIFTKNPSKSALPNHVYILEDDGSFETASDISNSSLNIERITTLFYQKYPDIYDFIAIFPSFSPKREMSDAIAYNSGIQNNVRGICMEIRKACYWGPCGSDKLQAVHIFTSYKNNYNELVEKPQEIVEILLHEIGHRWGVFLGNRKAENPLPDGINKSCTEYLIPFIEKDTDHWSENLQMPIGGYGAIPKTLPWIERGQDIYSYNLSYFEEPPKYHPFDLYLMGLLDPSEIKNGFLLLTEVDYYFSPMSDGKEATKDEIVKKGKSIKVSIDDVIKIAGESRNPSVQNSQKDFKEAFVILTKKGQLPPQNMFKAIDEAAKLLSPMWLFATDNRSTMNK